jgi:membrane protein implicated in regulation of membrane protease activity
MIYLYLAITIISAVLLSADALLRYMEKIKSFGFEGKLFKLKGETIPMERFFPKTLTMAFGWLLSFGAAGIIFEITGFNWYFSLPFSFMTAFLVCFVLQYFLKGAVDKFMGRILPAGAALEGLQGFAYEDIGGADYGQIELEYNDLTFHVPAVSVNGTAIPRFEKVVVLFEEEGCYFVQSIKEVFEPLNEPDKFK